MTPEDKDVITNRQTIRAFRSVWPKRELSLLEEIAKKNGAEVIFLSEEDQKYTQISSHRMNDIWKQFWDEYYQRKQVPPPFNQTQKD